MRWKPLTEHRSGGPPWAVTCACTEPRASMPDIRPLCPRGRVQAVWSGRAEPPWKVCLNALAWLISEERSAGAAFDTQRSGEAKDARAQAGERSHEGRCGETSPLEGVAAHAVAARGRLSRAKDRMTSSLWHQYMLYTHPMMQTRIPPKSALLALKDEELLERVNFNDAEFDQLENDLALRAACLGWTGDPMKQPAEVVAAVVRNIISKRQV